MDLNKVKEATDFIKTELAPLAEKIGQGAGITFDLFVRQAYVNKISYFIVMSVLLPVFAIVSKKMHTALVNWRKRENPDRYTWYREAQTTYWIIMPAVMLVSTILWLDAATDLVAVLVNPEFQAIKLIIEMVQSEQ